MQNILNLSKTNKLILAAFAFLAVLAIGGGRASAATITVGGSCEFADAIDSLNAASNQSGCTSTGAYGANDTINLPAGTQTLSNDLPSFTTGHDITIVGAGLGNSIIDANGNLGMQGQDNAHVKYWLKDFTIENADNFAIYFDKNSEVVLENIEVANSMSGADVRALNITISGCLFHDNANPSDLAGLRASFIAFSGSDEATVNVENTKVYDNSGERAGLVIVNASGVPPTSTTVKMNNVEVSGNEAELVSGLDIEPSSGNTIVFIDISSSTVANNSTTATVDRSNADPLNKIRLSGMIASLANLQPGNHLVNVTIANNTMTNNVDNLAAVAGFFITSFNATSPLSQVNTTVVNNTVIHPGVDGSIGSLPAFSLISFDQSGSTVTSGGSVQNSLIANNKFNGQIRSCRTDFSLSTFELSGTVDLTPVNNGNNITDDPNCTGYDYQSNIYSTLGPLQYNGGQVKTIALLPGSLAINAGGRVLGVSTDARGIARPTDCVSVGAFQFEGAVCGASTTAGAGGGAASAPSTGAKSTSTLSAMTASVLGISFLGYTFGTKRKYK